jgi:hypothetical protein
MVHAHAQIYACPVEVRGLSVSSISYKYLVRLIIFTTNQWTGVIFFFGIWAFIGSGLIGFLLSFPYMNGFQNFQIFTEIHCLVFCLKLTLFYYTFEARIAV